MPIPRLALGFILLMTPLLHAQNSEDKKEPAQAAPAPAPVQHTQATSDSYKITITFKAMDGGKITTQRSYTLIATTHEASPKIRDDSRIPVATTGTVMNQYTYQDARTDVDVDHLNKTADGVLLDLQISTTDFVPGSSNSGISLAPIQHSHTYMVTPTLQLNKLITVYSSTDTVNSTSVEVQVLVQPAQAAGSK